MGSERLNTCEPEELRVFDENMGRVIIVVLERYLSVIGVKNTNIKLWL